MQHPMVSFLLIVAFIGGVGVYPLIKSWPVSLRWGKILAAGLVLGVCIFGRSYLPALLSLWPLSLIWFPEYWGKFRGSLYGPAIDQESPPLVVAFCGWIFLLTVLVILFWMNKQ